MKNFTTLRAAAVCTLICLFSAVMPAKAAWTSVSDFYGKYKFTSTMTVVTANAELEQYYGNNTEVVISKHSIYDAQIVGLAGAQGKQMVNDTDLDGMRLNVSNPSGSRYDTWGQGIYMADADGNNPFGETQYTVIYTWDEANQCFTLPDFSLVTCDYGVSPVAVTVLAKFTGCKLELVEKETVEVADVSGDWHYNAAANGFNEESTFPKEFDLTLTASDDTYKAYTGNLTFEGYPAIALTGITFDGTKLNIPFENVYVDEANKLRLGQYNYSTKEYDAKGVIEFNYSSETSMMLSSLLSIIDETKTAEEELQIQWFVNGVIKKEGAVIVDDPVGVYRVKAETVTNIDAEANYPSEVTFTVTRNAVTDGLYVTAFCGTDISQSNRGGIPCTQEDNVLKISTSKSNNVAFVSSSDDAGNDVMTYDKLFDGEGGTTKTVDITKNADGTYSITDFFIKRRVLVMQSVDPWATISDETKNWAFYGYTTFTVTKEDLPAGISATQAAGAKVYANQGTIYVKGAEKAQVEVYTVAGARVFKGNVSQVNGLNKGIYVVKVNGEFAGKVAL